MLCSDVGIIFIHIYRRFSDDDLIWLNGIADEYLICLKMDKERLDVSVSVRVNVALI